MSENVEFDLDLEEKNETLEIDKLNICEDIHANKDSALSRINEKNQLSFSQLEVAPLEALVRILNDDICTSQLPQEKDEDLCFCEDEHRAECLSRADIHFMNWGKVKKSPSCDVLMTRLGPLPCSSLTKACDLDSTAKSGGSDKESRKSESGESSLPPVPEDSTHDDDDDDDDDFEIVESFDSHFEISLQIKTPPAEPPDYDCSDCGESTVFCHPRFCHFCGRNFCKNCLTEDEALIPALVFNLGDWNLRRVCRPCAAAIDQHYFEPILRLDADAGQEHFREILLLRREAAKAAKIYMSCPSVNRQDVDRLRALVWPREYVLRDADRFSLADLDECRRKKYGTILKGVAKMCGRHARWCSKCRRSSSEKREESTETRAGK